MKGSTIYWIYCCVYIVFFTLSLQVNFSLLLLKLPIQGFFFKTTSDSNKDYPPGSIYTPNLCVYAYYANPALQSHKRSNYKASKANFSECNWTSKTVQNMQKCTAFFGFISATNMTLFVAVTKNGLHCGTNKGICLIFYFFSFHIFT